MNTIQFCHPIRPDYMFVAGAGKGHFEVTGWSVSQSKAIKLVHLDGLDSSKFEGTVPSSKILKTIKCCE